MDLVTILFLAFFPFFLIIATLYRLIVGIRDRDTLAVIGLRAVKLGLVGVKNARASCEDHRDHDKKPVYCISSHVSSSKQ